MHELQLEFRVLTPLYCEGAKGSRPSVRVPSLKGALRYWYRAADPYFNCNAKGELHKGKRTRQQPTREEMWFGGVRGRSGQSPFLLRVEEKSRLWSWEEPQIRRFDAGHGSKRKNGVRYLAGPGGLKDRQAIASGSTFTVRAIWPRGANEMQRRAFLAGVWQFAHIGGLGSRSRRGFGSVCLERWKVLDGEGKSAANKWPELEQLPLLCDASGVRDWQAKFGRVIGEVLRGWFAVGDEELDKKAKRSPTRGANTYGDGFDLLGIPHGSDDWMDAMNKLGRYLQDYRVRSQPDYDDVKAHLRRERQLRTAPERSAFGLPLTFRYSSLRGTRADFEASPRLGEGPSRHASPLWLRIARMGKSLVKVAVLLDAPIPGRGTEGGFANGTHVKLKRARRPLAPPQKNALGGFFDYVERNPR